MPTSNSLFRSEIAKEMLDIRREKNESLEQFDKRNFIYRILNKKKREEIIENFENKIDEIREKP
jgi:catalase